MKWVVGTAAAIAAFAAGFYVCALLKPRADFSFGIDAGSVMDAVVLLAIGIGIEYGYSKRSSAKDADTKLLLEVIDEAKQAFRRLESAAEPCESDKKLTKLQQQSLTCAERELSNAVHSIEVALGHCNIDKGKFDLSKLKEARSDLKDALTDDPYPGPYAGADKSRVRAASKTVRDELTRVSFAINRR